MNWVGIWLAALAVAGVFFEANFFPYREGWLGADAAYSIPLDRTSTVWLFGDTFTGKQREPKTMIHNSIGLRQCAPEGGCSVSYWWSGMHTQHASSFFKTPESDYYWPLDGLVYGQRLYVFLEEMHATGDDGAFGFDYSRIVLATVSNFGARPDRWQISYQTISTGNRVVPGIAAAVKPGQSPAEYLYVLALFRKSAAKPFAGLLRLKLSDLGAAATAQWQYLADGGKWVAWKRSTSPADAATLLHGNITEMSVAFHADRQEWIAVYPAPGMLSNAAVYNVASKLEGPWQGPRKLFGYPEMTKGDPRYTAHVFCYAAKEHPELESGNEMALTYACNSTQEPEILRDMRLYRPELVKRDLPRQ